jgi:hypothetical protein
MAAVRADLSPVIASKLRALALPSSITAVNTCSPRLTVTVTP